MKILSKIFIKFFWKNKNCICSVTLISPQSYGWKALKLFFKISIDYLNWKHRSSFSSSNPYIDIVTKLRTKEQVF